MDSRSDHENTNGDQNITDSSKNRIIQRKQNLHTQHVAAADLQRMFNVMQQHMKALTRARIIFQCQMIAMGSVTFGLFIYMWKRSNNDVKSVIMSAAIAHSVLNPLCDGPVSRSFEKNSDWPMYIAIIILAYVALLFLTGTVHQRLSAPRKYRRALNKWLKLYGLQFHERHNQFIKRQVHVLPIVATPLSALDNGSDFWLRTKASQDRTDEGRCIVGD